LSLFVNFDTDETEPKELFHRTSCREGNCNRNPMSPWEFLAVTKAG